MIRFLLVIVAHYYIYGGPRHQWWTVRARHWLNLLEGGEEGERIKSWPRWGRGKIEECPDCGQDFIQYNDRDCRICQACASTLFA